MDKLSHVLKFIFLKAYFIPEMFRNPNRWIEWEKEEVMVEVLVETVEDEEQEERGNEGT